MCSSDFNVSLWPVVSLITACTSHACCGGGDCRGRGCVGVLFPDQLAALLPCPSVLCPLSCSDDTAQHGPSLVMQCASTCVARLKRAQPHGRLPLQATLLMGHQVHRSHGGSLVSCTRWCVYRSVHSHNA